MIVIATGIVNHCWRVFFLLFSSFLRGKRCRKQAALTDFTGKCRPTDGSVSALLAGRSAVAAGFKPAGCE
ncbi:hypothetical protein PR001_g1004 [Phytophthora rubi]|uniref:Secreted protein n=1 Tax=Phytophthora rubi TaxID=129364 RepID=A0A6A3P1R2_9STRA|nr:hypothetical protein PR001_g1004 [Phytophthora rubi]